MQNTTLNFWNSVSEIYENSELTKHQSDEELTFVLNQINNIRNVNGLISLGVADGCRDPAVILEFLEKKHKLPQVNIYNDFSDKLLEVCKKRISAKFPTLNASYVNKPIHEIEWPAVANVHNNIFIGCYNVEYIKESLEIYKQQQNVIGQYFEIKFVKFQNGKLSETNDVVNFHIDSHLDSFDKIQTKISTTENFIACSIKTDTGFISHHYDHNKLKSLMEFVFGKTLWVTRCGNRYIVTHIMQINRNNKGPECIQPSQYVTTCLNNVLGNIPLEHQISSLLNIKKIQ